MNGSDDSLDDLEARLRAWRPADVPPALHARLHAAAPHPRRAAGAMRRAGVWMTGALVVLAAGVALHRGGSIPPVARRTPEGARLVDAAWTPGAGLTMNLSTGVPLGNIRAPWNLDDETAAAGSLFPVRSADGKLLLKVDCQF